MTLTDFLLARTAEDEAAARAAIDAELIYDSYGETAHAEMLALATGEGASDTGRSQRVRFRLLPLTGVCAGLAYDG